MARLVRRPERGASAVEFALVMLPLLYLVFGIIQYGLYFWGMQAGTSATSDAVRRITVGDCETAARAPAIPEGPASERVPDCGRDRSARPRSTGMPTAGQPSSPGVGGSVTLTVTFDAIDLNFPFIPLPDDGKVTRRSSAGSRDVDHCERVSLMSSSWSVAARGEDGAVALIVAMLALVLVAISALAVDLGYAFAQKQAIQKRADFAALAGSFGDDLPMTAAGVVCNYGRAGRATDQAIIDVAAYLSEQPGGSDIVPTISSTAT